MENPQAIDLVDHVIVENLQSILSTGERNKSMIRMLRSHISQMSSADKEVYLAHKQSVYELMNIIESLADEDICYAKNQLNIKEK